MVCGIVSRTGIDANDSDADSWQQAWGDAYVPEYSPVGHRLIDFFS